MKLALCLFSPPKTAPIFEHVVRLYYAHLQDLGYEVVIVYNRLLKNHLNLWLGYQYLPLESQDMVIENFDYVLLQFEQLGVKSGWFSEQDHSLHDFLPLLKGARAIWDYTPENITFLNGLGCSAEIMPLGYHPSLQSFTPHSAPQIDVLFFGSLSERRLDLINRLKPHCQVACLYNVYQTELENALQNSKIVLNLHHYENAPLLEQVRLFYLFSNQVFVISEDSSWNPYGKGLITSPYETLKDTVLDWLQQPQAKREFQAQEGNTALKTITFKENLQQALESVLENFSGSN